MPSCLPLSHVPHRFSFNYQSSQISHLEVPEVKDAAVRAWQRLLWVPRRRSKRFQGAVPERCVKSLRVN